MSRQLHIKRCPYCFYFWAKKNGHTARGDQRYMCKQCEYQFTDRSARDNFLEFTHAHPSPRKTHF